MFKILVPPKDKAYMKALIGYQMSFPNKEKKQGFEFIGFKGEHFKIAMFQTTMVELRQFKYVPACMKLVKSSKSLCYEWNVFVLKS